MIWSNENVMKFLKSYRRHSCLWDPSHPENALVRSRTRAWHAIKKEMGASYTIAELKKKKEILLGTYRRFKRNELKSKSSNFQANWFAYSLIDSFFAPVYCTRNIENKDRSGTYSSSDVEDVKEEQNFLSTSIPKSEIAQEQGTEMANLDVAMENYNDNKNDATNAKDTEDKLQTFAYCTETQTDWSRDNVIKFIKLFQMYPCLWDPSSPKRKSRDYRNKAWRAIKKGLGDLYTIEELKKKKETLRCAYRRCKKNEKKLKSMDCIYQPSWFAFSIIDSFLGSISEGPEASQTDENNECTTGASSEDDMDVNVSKNDPENEAKQYSHRTESHGWTKDNILKFIELFQSFPCLWNSLDPDYTNRRRRTQAWLAIKKELGDRFNINELRRKKESLLCTYRKCKKNGVEQESINCVYEPTWFAFSAMDSFWMLCLIDKRRQIINLCYAYTEDRINKVYSGFCDKDHNTANSCYNYEDVQRHQNSYSSLPSRLEDPLELATEIANSELNEHDYDDNSQGNVEREQRLNTLCTHTQMDWSNEIVLKFLDIFQRYPCLWNPMNSERAEEQYVTIEAWNAIKKEIGDPYCTVEELKRRKDSLLARYRICKKKLIETNTQPSWFAFSVMDGFFGPIYECQESERHQENFMWSEDKEADSSHYLEEESDSSANNEPEYGTKEENYVLIVSTQEEQRKIPLEMQIELDDRIVKRSARDAQDDTEEEQVTTDYTHNRMKWSNKDVLQFLELYKGHSVLWDSSLNPRCTRTKKRVTDAWNAIKKDMGNRCTIEELKKKKESLMSAYRARKTKVIKSESTNDLYQPVWFAYPVMDEFLGSVYKCSASSNTDSRGHKTAADSIYYQDEWNNSIEGEPEIENENFVSIVSTSAIKRVNPLEVPVDVREITTSKHDDDEDECLLFGKLVTSKLRKVPHYRRDWLMLKINELFYECKNDSTIIKYE